MLMKMGVYDFPETDSDDTVSDAFPDIFFVTPSSSVLRLLKRHCMVPAQVACGTKAGGGAQGCRRGPGS